MDERESEFSVSVLDQRLELHGSGSCCCFCCNGSDADDGPETRREEDAGVADGDGEAALE